MTVLTSNVQGSGPHSLGELFPTYLPDIERLVYQYVVEATQWRVGFPEDGGGLTLPATFSQRPLLDFFAQCDLAGLAIPVVRGWPAFPGKIPAIGVALGSEAEDAAQELEAGGFVGDVFALDSNGARVGTAAYFSLAMYTPVVVELIHENRDERDRLHEILKPTLFRLNRLLPDEDPKIHKVRVSAEKQEVSGGPPEADQPFVVYISVFTVECWYEMLEAVDVRGEDGIIGAITVTVDPAHTLSETDVHAEAT